MKNLCPLKTRPLICIFANIKNLMDMDISFLRKLYFPRLILPVRKMNLSRQLDKLVFSQVYLESFKIFSYFLKFCNKTPTIYKNKPKLKYGFAKNSGQNLQDG